MDTVTARPTSVFRSSAFSRFYAGQALSYLGDGLRTIAIPLLVFHLTGSAVAVGLTWGLELLPYAVVSLLAGSLADRVDRRRLMIACDALRFAVMAGFCVALITGRLSLPLIYVGVFVLAIGGSIFLGSQAPSIPYLLGKDRAKAGVATMGATEQTVNLIAPPLGGALLGVVGPLPLLIVNAVTYLGSQAAVASVRTFGPDAPSGLPSLREIREDIGVGWRFVRGEGTMLRLSLFSAAANFVGTLGFVSLIPYLKRSFEAGDHVVGIAFGCFSAGAALGALLAGRTHWPVGIALVIANLGDGLGWLPLPFTHSLPVAVAGVAFSSVCAGYYITTLVSWRMRVIPEELVGRVFGVVRFLVLGGILPASLLGGWLSDHIGVRPTVAISAFGYLFVTMIVACSRVIRAEHR
jgi:MFS family permease